MDVIITVFGGDNSNVIIALESKGFAPFIDGIHQRDITWLKDNFKQEHRLYELVNGTVKDYTIEIIDDSCAPNVAISLCEGQIPPPMFWRCVWYFMTEMFGIAADGGISADVGESMMIKPVKNLKIDLDEYDHLPEFDGKIGKWEASANGVCKPTELMTEGVVYRMKSEPPEVVGGYFLDTYPIEDLDIMIYQVIKPGLKLPITVVVRNFSEHGHKRFFSDIYGSNEWHRNESTDRFDVPFLKENWKKFGLYGEFGRYVIEERIKGCLPSAGRVPDAEPEIYRKDIMRVVDTLKLRNAPCNHKKKKR